jgi:hypothetical protein
MLYSMDHPRHRRKRVSSPNTDLVYARSWYLQLRHELLVIEIITRR